MRKFTMQDYIEETSSIAKHNIKEYKELTQPLTDIISETNIDTLWLIASGSSYNSCYCAKSFMEKHLDFNIKIITPYTFVWYEHKMKKNDIVIVVTQSGMSTNAIEAIEKLKKLGKKTICLTGNINSDVKKYADIVLDYGVGEELVGYVTKGVSMLCLYLMLLTINLSKNTTLLSEIEKAVAIFEDVKEKTYMFIKENYKSLSSMNWSYCCGAGTTYGVALEGALKIGETIHVPSCCYELEEYIHGPNLQLSPKYTVFIFDGNDHASKRVSQIYNATRKVTENVFMISANKEFRKDNHVLVLNEVPLKELSSFVYLPFVQLISFVISDDLKSIKQHPLLKEFKAIAAAKTESFVNYDDDE